MGSKAVKIMLEVLVAIAVASGLSYIPAIGGNVLIDFAIIPLILLSLRHGGIWGAIASVLFGLLHAVLHPSGAGYIVVPFHDSVMAYGFVAFAGFFARNTVRTAFNARISSTVLNVVTASIIATFVSYGFHAIASAIGAPTLFATEKVALASGFLGFSANFIATLVVTLVVLVTLIYVKRDIYIPKGTRYLSRKEKSHLLND